MGRQVAVDLVFLLNFAVDGLLLWLAALWPGARAAPPRLVLAAAAGGAAAVLAQFPGPGAWLGRWPLKLAVAAAMVAAAFAPCPPRLWGRALAAFCCAGFLLGGGALAAALALAPPGLGPAAPSTPVALGLGLSMAGATLLARWWRQRGRLAPGLVAVRLGLGDRALSLTGLVDSGCQLSDPLSGAPLLVAEAGVLGPLLPPAVWAELERAAGAAGEGQRIDALARLPSPWQERCRLVPFSSLGCPGALLPALRLDSCAVTPAAGPARPGPRLVALAPRPLHPAGVYRALVPPDI